MRKKSFTEAQRRNFERASHQMVEMHTTHGMSDSSEFWTWMRMKTRAFNPRIANVKEYSERGISMCRRWATSFEAFFEDLGPRPRGVHPSGRAKYSIDRIDNDGSYDCGKCQDCFSRGVVKINCRWATQKEQANNRRSSRVIEYRGESRTTTEWAKYLGVRRSTLDMRLSRMKENGRTLDEVLRKGRMPGDGRLPQRKHRGKILGEVE